MLSIVRSTRFIKSLQKLKASGKLSNRTIIRLTNTINNIAAEERLPSSYKDHSLAGDLQAYRECHIQGDLLLI